MKRIVAKIMAFVMLLGTVQVALPVQEVRAAETFHGTDFFNWRWNDRLNDSLALINQRTNKNEALLEFGMSEIGHNSLKPAGTKHTLTYHTMDYRQQEVTFERLSDEAVVVKYRLKDLTPPSPYIPLTAMSGPDGQVSGWQLFRLTGGQYSYSAPSFRDDVYLLTANNTVLLPDPADSDYPDLTGYNAKVGTIGGYEPWVSPPHTADDIWQNEIAFMITKGNGFAFRVGQTGEEIKIKWDGDRMLFQTSGAVANGNIYDFNLEVMPTVGTALFDETLKIITGYQDSAITAIPYDGGNLNSPNNVVLANGETAKEPEIHVQLSMPRAFGTDKFDYITSSYPFAGNLSIALSMNHLLIQPASMFTNETITVHDNSTRNNIEVDYKTTTSTITFEVKDLPHSAIYDRSMVRFGSDIPGLNQEYNTVYSDQLFLAQNTVYSYLKYDITRNESDSYIVRIDPYRTFSTSTADPQFEPVPGKYQIYRGIGSSTNELVGEKTHTNTSEPIDIVISPPGGNYYYDIKFVPYNDNSKTLKSQVLQVIPGDDRLYIDRPRDLQIRRGPNVIRVEDSSLAPLGYQDYIKTTLRWRVGYHDTILNLNDSAKVGVGNETKFVDYHFLTSNRSGDNPSSKNDFLTLRLDMDKPKDVVAPGSSVSEAFEVESGNGIVILSDAYRVESVNGQEVGYAEVELLIPTYENGTVNTSVPVADVAMPYKGLYYIYSFAAYERMSVATLTSNSNEINFSISGLENLTVPTPQDLKLGNETTSSFISTWNMPGEQLFAYMENSLHPKQRTMHYDALPNGNMDRSMRFYIYLTQDYDHAKLLGNEKDATAVDDYEPGGLYAGSMEWIDGYNDSVLAGSYLTNSGASVRDALNDGKMIRIEYFDPEDPFTTLDSAKSMSSFGYTLRFNGLDDNMDYYVVVRALIEPYSMDWGMRGGIPVPGLPNYEVVGASRRPKAEVAQPDEMIYSVNSVIETIRTTPDISTPDPNEGDPPAPTGLDTEDLTGNSVTVFWDRLKRPAGDTSIDLDRIEYEVLRVEGGQLENNFNVNKNVIKDILELMSKEYSHLPARAWRTVNSNSTYTGGPSLKLLTSSAPNEDSYAVSTDYHKLTDNNLTPNKIYYYYVRTVSYHSDTDPRVSEPHRYSEWVGVSVTTKPIDRPVNLKVDRTRVTDEVEKRSKVGLTFDGPVSMSEVNSGKYSYQISYKSDKETNYRSPITMSGSNLSGGTEISTETKDYYTFQYLLEGLEPGTMYFIRVRVIDNDSKDESNWSNIVEHRTEYDPGEYITDENTEKYYDLLVEKLLERLVRKPYWRLQDDTRAFVAVYKSQRMDAELQVNANGYYVLAQDAAEADSTVIYVPIAALEKANNAMTGLAVEVDDVTVIIPYDAMDKSETESMLDIIKRKNDRDIDDYFVKITVALTREKGTIEGNDALSDRIDIKIETTGFEMQETRWDSRIEEMHINYIKDPVRAKDLKAQIKNEINSGASDSEMIIFIDELIDEIEEDLIDDVDDDFKDYSRYTYTTDALVKPMTVVANPIDAGTSVSAYQYAAGNWLSKEVFDYSGRKAFMTVNPGIYVFAGINISLPSDMPGGSIVTNLISKYGLLELLGKDLNLNAPVTNHAVLGSIARMAGASRTEDAATYLRGKGLIVSTRDLYSPAAQQDVVYLSVGLYGIKTNTNISTVRITNHTLGNDIRGLNGQYAQHVKVAYQLGFISGDLQPRGQMTIREFLELLSKVAPKSNL